MENLVGSELPVKFLEVDEVSSFSQASPFPCANQWRWVEPRPLIRIFYPSQEKERLVFSNKRVAGATTADLQGYKVRAGKLLCLGRA